MPSGPSSKSGRTKTTTDDPGHIERGSGNVFPTSAFRTLTWPSPRPNSSDTSGTSSRAEAHAGEGRRAARARPAEGAALVRGRVAGYTLDRLFRFPTALGQRVEITVRPNAKNP